MTELKGEMAGLNTKIDKILEALANNKYHNYLRCDVVTHLHIQFFRT